MQRRGFIIGQSQPIRTAGGAALSVAGVTFRDASNTPVQDSAYLHLREVYTVPQMVLSDMPTNSRAGQLLISGGEFDVQVYAANGRQLRVSLALPTSGNAALPVWQSPIPPEQDTTPQQFWQMPTLGAGWILASSVAVQTVAQPTFVTGPAYQLQLPLDSTRYANIDQLYHQYQGNPTLGTVTITAPTTAAANDTRVLLRPVGYNGIFRVRTSVASGSSTSWTASLPVGTPIKAVVLQSVRGQLYMGTQQMTVAATTALTPPLTPVSEAGALALIQAL